MQTKTLFMLASLILFGVVLRPGEAYSYAVSPHKKLQEKQNPGTQEPEPKLTQKVEASNKYGEGGHVQTVSDEKFLVSHQVWYDKNNKKREIYTPRHYDYALKTYFQQWEFFEPGKSETLVTIQYDPKAGSFSVYEKGKNTSKDADASQAEAWVAQFEKRFAEDGTVSRPWDETVTTVEQPKLPPTEVFNKPKETKSDPKPDEPKKTDPPKNEKPKTEKTSTDNSGSNTASPAANFTTAGYDIKIGTDSGLIRTYQTTPFGKITLNIPADVQPGQPFTGSIFVEPAGKTDGEQTQNLLKMGDLSFQMGDGTIFNVGKLMNNVENNAGETNLRPWQMTPAQRAHYEYLSWLSGDTPVLKLRDLPFLDELRPHPSTFTIPTVVQQGGFFIISGPFDGVLSKTDFVGMAGKSLPILAESLNGRVLWNTSSTLGEAKIEISENGQTGTCPAHNVGVRVSATNLKMKRGDHATVYVTFSGLAGLNQNMPYELVNHSPGVVSMEGGSEAKNGVVPAGSITNLTGPEKGTFTDTVGITGVNQGPFTITATLHWNETCDLPPDAMHKKGP